VNYPLFLISLALLMLALAIKFAQVFK